MTRLDIAYLLARDPVVWWHWERLEDELDEQAGDE